MESTPIYHFRKTRKQQSRLYFRMAAICWVYIIGLLAYESYYDTTVQEDFRMASLWGLSIASLVLGLVGLWHRRNPDFFEVLVTPQTLTVRYPGSESWSFECRIEDIKRFEHRRVHSHAGRSPLESGVLLNDGGFHHISMNYGNSLNDNYQAVKSVKPEVEFPATVNKKFSGLGLDRDYKE